MLPALRVLSAPHGAVVRSTQSLRLATQLPCNKALQNSVRCPVTVFLIMMCLRACGRVGRRDLTQLALLPKASSIQFEWLTIPPTFAALKRLPTSKQSGRPVCFQVGVANPGKLRSASGKARCSKRVRRKLSQVSVFGPCLPSTPWEAPVPTCRKLTRHQDPDHGLQHLCWEGRARVALPHAWRRSLSPRGRRKVGNTEIASHSLKQMPFVNRQFAAQDFETVATARHFPSCAEND